MAIVAINESTLTNIGNAIRGKKGSSALIDPDYMANEITSIPTSGVEVEEKDVNFIDYDGTLVYSYTAAEFAELTAMPANPSHEGLTAQGWNWSLADAKTYVASYGKHCIGQYYEPSDCDLIIKIILREGWTSPTLNLVLNGTATVTWGDGNTSTVTGTSTNVVVGTLHNYASAGNYTIKVSFTGRLQIGNVSNYNIFQGNPYKALIIEECVFGSRVEVYSFLFQNDFSIQRAVVKANGAVSQNGFFSGAYALKGLVLPPLYHQFYNYSLSQCYNLTYLSFGKNIDSVLIGSLQNMYSVRYLCFTDNITNFPALAFASCRKLQFIHIPKSLTAIPQEMMNNCNSVPNVIIPGNVTTIGAQAFNSCYSLKFIRFEPTTPPTVANSNAWKSIPTDCIMYVPITALAGYVTGTNYPNPATYTYIGYGTYTNGDTLPTLDDTQAYTLTWYATKEDAIAQTNPITLGNGNEVYCRYVAVV